MAPCRTHPLRRSMMALATVWVLGSTQPAAAELRIANVSVYLNGISVGVQVVLVGAVPDGVLERLHSGLPTHVRVAAELWQHRFLVDRRVHAESIERRITYDVLTKEYKVVSLTGEQREPYLTKDLQDAKRVLSEIRVGKLAGLSSLSPKETYYVRVRCEVTQSGANSWLARLTGDAQETAWFQSRRLSLDQWR